MATNNKKYREISKSRTKLGALVTFDPDWALKNSMYIFDDYGQRIHGMIQVNASGGYNYIHQSSFGILLGWISHGERCQVLFGDLIIDINRFTLVERL